MTTNGPVFPRQVRATIPDGVAQEIQRQIAAVALVAGQRLPSVEALAEDFGVSRTSIREAMQALAALGVIEEIGELGEALLQMRVAVGDLHQIVVWDTRFHEGIIRASHNRLLDQALALTVDFLTQARYRMHSVPGEVDRALAAHARIHDAIARRDPDEAARAMREHLRGVEQDLGIALP